MCGERCRGQGPCRYCFSVYVIRTLVRTVSSIMRGKTSILTSNVKDSNGTVRASSQTPICATTLRDGWPSLMAETFCSRRRVTTWRERNSASKYTCRSFGHPFKASMTISKTVRDKYAFPVDLNVYDFKFFKSLRDDNQGAVCFSSITSGYSGAA